MPTFAQMANKLRENEVRPQYFGDENFLKGKALPASFSYIRPGLREDPGLRDFYRQYYLKGGPIDSPQMLDPTDPFLFVFDSEQQLNRWFFDEEERKLLLENGFGVVKRRVAKETVIRGHAQCLWKTKNLCRQQNAA